MKTEKNKKYDSHEVKEMILDYAKEVYFYIGRLNRKDTQIEEEITAGALNRLLDADKGNRGEYLELKGIFFMLKGLSDSLRLYAQSVIVPEQDNKPSMYDDDAEPF